MAYNANSTITALQTVLSRMLECLTYLFAARLGLTQEAAELTTQKLKNSGRRFPAFWGPEFDWTPDHNWYAHFKLHASYQTTIEGILRGGIELINVIPASRGVDIINCFNK